MTSILDNCRPRPELLTGAFNPEIFTANLMQVIDHYRGEPGVIENIYTDPTLFFSAGTFPTEGMRQVLRNVFGRLKGKDASYPSIQRLETAFGGGKTHTLIAATHLAYRGTEISELASQVIESDLLPGPREITVVGIAGDRVAIHDTKGSRLIPYTLWGEIAFQVGGEQLYQDIGPGATSFGSPGDEYFDLVFKGRKVLIMFDELAAYATRVEAARPRGGASVATFLMSLFQYARVHTGIAVVLTLASQRDAFARQTAMLVDLVAGAKGEEVDKADALSIAARADSEVRSVVARDATAVTPVRGQEISRVLARRLFEQIDETAATATANAYMDLYSRTATLLPEAAKQETFRGRMAAHYPFHPTLIDYLTEKLSTVETFQGTRGVLRVLALTVANIWREKTAIPMIHACHLDLRDPRLSDELISRTESSELLPIVTADIGGAESRDLSAEDSNAALADRSNPHPEGFKLYESTWKTVFLHSLAGFGDGFASNVFGISKPDALFATAFPGMTPPQVEEALNEIRRSAYYLRYSETEGRYYASTGVSINIVLANIRKSLKGSSHVGQLLAETSRKVVKPGTLNFEVVSEVEVPERITDNTGKPTLALIALHSSSIRPEEFITQAGPNRPRMQQNLVFLLVPDTVEVQGEQRKDDNMFDNVATRAMELKDRLHSIATDVLARRMLKHDPTAYGLSETALSDESFSRDTKEREHALVTVVTQAYRNLWFPGQDGAIIRREISTAGGEGGRPVIESIREVLLNEGELITPELATSTTASASGAKLFFAVQDFLSLEEIRNGFACKRAWPVLAEPGVLDTLLRSGIRHGAWCLFRMDNEQSVKPTAFYARETEEIPFSVNLAEKGWSIVTPQGAKQRGWTASDKPDTSQIRKWVSDELNQKGYSTVAEVAAGVEQTHGNVSSQEVCKAVDDLVKSGQLYVHAPDQDPQFDSKALRGAGDWIMESVTPAYKVVTKPEASKRGWITAKRETLQFSGSEARQKVLPLLKSLAQLYKTGGKSTIDYLEVSGLQLPGGGVLNVQLENLKPRDINVLGDFFDIALDLDTQKTQTEVQLVINSPEAECKLVEKLKSTKD